MLDSSDHALRSTGIAKNVLDKNGNIPMYCNFYTRLIMFPYLAFQYTGPFIVDVSPPLFAGRITLDVVNEFMVARWKEGDFYDKEDQDALDYTFSIGMFPICMDV